MKILSSIPVLKTADVNKTADWYRNNLSFTVQLFPATGQATFGIFRRDETEIMFQRVEGYKKENLKREDGLWDVYLRVKGAESLHRSLDTLKVAGKLRRQPYGSIEFDVVDPNGYVLVFGEEN